MLSFALAGASLALGHHLYYDSLDGTAAGSSTRQQWTSRFGTAFSFLIVALLKAANDAAYTQYIWTLVRGKSFCIASLDKLFFLISDPIALFGVDLMKNATFAVLLALICWTTTIAGITPPATLSVVPGLVADMCPTSIMALDWNAVAFYDLEPFLTLPSAKVIQIATQSAESMAVIPLTPPAPNSSFSLQFYGPPVQCSLANRTQQAVFDYYASVIGYSPALTTTQRSLEIGNITITDQNATDVQFGAPAMVLLSAFAPYGGPQGWLFGTANTQSVDQFNNWDVDLPWDDLGGTADDPEYDDVVQQLWVQTSTDAYICLLGNASYNVDLGFVDGVQTTINSSTSGFEPILISRLGGEGVGQSITPGPYEREGPTGFEYSYMAVWEAFTSMISGNITMSLTYSLSNSTNSNMSLFDSSSRALLNGLSACDDIVHSFWDENPIGIGPNGVVLLNSTEFAHKESVFHYNLNISNRLFEKPSWMCRNRTLINAIEDLANNITISMLSSADLSTANSTLVNVTYTTTRNIYQYDSRNLVLSYSIAIFFAILGVSLGMFSFSENGVAHNSAFSAIVATTRKSALDSLSIGDSLGAVPLDEEVKGVRLRFGELAGSLKQSGFGVPGLDYGSDGGKHIGFGFEDDVMGLRKGAKYF